MIEILFILVFFCQIKASQLFPMPDAESLVTLLHVLRGVVWMH